MTFPEIFENFKNHSYIRRQSWSDNVFVQLRHNSTLIRMVMFVNGSIKTLSLDIRLYGEDLLGNDWVDIDEC